MNTLRFCAGKLPVRGADPSDISSSPFTLELKCQVFLLGRYYRRTAFHYANLTAASMCFYHDHNLRCFPYMQL